MNIEKAVEEFKKYTNGYIDLNKMCKLKVNHTFRVMELCFEIAKSLGLSDEEIELAKMCGLLHDIGRFEQWKRFQTFDDRKSIDHADLGVEILTTNNYIRKYVKDNKYDSLILTSIKYHNKYNIPDNLDKSEKLFLNIVRDADKIDILYLYVLDEIHIDTKDTSFSDSVYKTLLNQKIVNKKDKTTIADNLSISLGFIFDINYKKSFEIIKEKDYLNKMIDTYKKETNNNELIEQLENVKKIINNYIEERFLNVRKKI